MIAFMIQSQIISQSVRKSFEFGDVAPHLWAGCMRKIYCRCRILFNVKRNFFDEKMTWGCLTLLYSGQSNDMYIFFIGFFNWFIGKSKCFYWSAISWNCSCTYLYFQSQITQLTSKKCGNYNSFKGLDIPYLWYSETRNERQLPWHQYRLSKKSVDRNDHHTKWPSPLKDVAGHHIT